MIKKIKISNFKSFYGLFELELNQGINILVGNNESGKSTILEAIHLALTGMYNGRGIRNELSPYLFNNQAVKEYLDSLTTQDKKQPPTLEVEIFFEGRGFPTFEGNNNSERANQVAVFRFTVAFSETYKDEYELLLSKGEIKSLPIEYYEASWITFARSNITSKSIPVKSVLIDSANYRYQNGSDVYISRIVRDILEPQDIISISQAHRNMVDGFAADPAIKTINEKISSESTIVDGDISLSADLGSKNSWENSLVTQVAGVPFSYIGKGAQCVVKTELALSHKRAQDAGIVLIEEPESHLSFANLNQLISSIQKKYQDKQIIISTHSSYVANKLGLEKLILLNDHKVVVIHELSSADFFKKMAGYDTLRLILCKRAILVEGDSDELVIQRAYMDQNDGKLPIYDGIDVISVGIAFLRFLELAKRLNIPVAVVTDNDGDLEALEKKYEEYRSCANIKICYDHIVDTGTLKIGKSDYNYNTLEPKLLKENSLATFNTIFGTTYTDEDELRKYMKHHKTECAMRIFDAEQSITFPNYIMEAIKNE